MNGKGIIYLAGPVAAATEAEVDKNIEQAQKWTLKLIKAGYAVYSPVLYGIAREDKDTGWQDFMRNHLTILKALAVNGQCTIALLPGWESSKGVSIEVFNAEAYHDLQVVPVEALMPEFNFVKYAVASGLEDVFRAVENDTNLSTSDYAYQDLSKNWEEAYTPHHFKKNVPKMGTIVPDLGTIEDTRMSFEKRECWCGENLRIVESPDFYECPVHGVNCIKLPKSYPGIAISGKARSGKTMLAKMLLEKLGPGWRIESISDAIMLEWMKEKHFEFYAENGPTLSLEWADRQKEIDPEVRPQLIELGARRRAENPNYWLERLNCNAGAIVPNCRLRNEYDFFKERGFLMVRIEADSTTRLERGCVDIEDSSETELDNIPFYKWDYWLDNNGSDLDYLGYEADNIVEIINKTGE